MTPKTQTDTPTKIDAALVLASEHGKVTIQDHVVAKIAGLAVREVKGVHALMPYGAGQAITNLAHNIRGEDEQRDLGVKVEVGTVECAVDVRIVTEYGASIPAVAVGIREMVSARIQEMTGLKTKEVNIDVLDLWFSEDDEPQVVSPRVQ
ncbi:MAG: Asp23/Gls24 family envelope stress response protein [Pseudomonadota bacterium]